MDDGFNPEFVETAFFSGNLEIPQLKQPEELIIPKGMIRVLPTFIGTRKR